MVLHARSALGGMARRHGQRGVEALSELLRERLTTSTTSMVLASSKVWTCAAGASVRRGGATCSLRLARGFLLPGAGAAALHAAKPKPTQSKPAGPVSAHAHARHVGDERE